MNKRTVIFVFVLAGALVLSDLSAGSTRGERYRLSATLTARQEVPRPHGTKVGERGRFLGRVIGRKLIWKLTFRKLTGRATQAHIHLGKRGVAGKVIVALCGPCKSGIRNIITISESAEKAITTGKAYVNVHTARNPKGEIRGQVKSRESTR